MSLKYESNFQAQLSSCLVLDSKKGKGKQEAEAYRQTLAELSKKISQIIAKSWLPNDPEGAEIKKVLLEGNSQEVKDMFKKYGADIDEFAKPYNVLCNVDWDTFFGSAKEIATGDNVWVCNLPYPPRPMEVTDTQLTDWVNNNDPEVVYPPYAYIPLSTCSC